MNGDICYYKRNYKTTDRLTGLCWSVGANSDIISQWLRRIGLVLFGNLSQVPLPLVCTTRRCSLRTCAGLGHLRSLADHLILNGDLERLSVIDEPDHGALCVIICVRVDIGDHGGTSPFSDHLLQAPVSQSSSMRSKPSSSRNTVSHRVENHAMVHHCIATDVLKHGIDAVGGLRKLVIADAVHE